MVTSYVSAPNERCIVVTSSRFGLPGVNPYPFYIKTVQKAVTQKKKKMDACLSNKKALFFQVHSGQVKRRVLCYPWTFESISPQTTVASGQLSCILTWNPETERAILQRKSCHNPGILAKSTTGHKITVSVTEG